MTFGELAVGEKFIDVTEGNVAQAYQKKSNTSAYALIGGSEGQAGELVIEGKSITEKFGKKAPVIKIEA